jgi:hypothetical protein
MFKSGIVRPLFSAVTAFVVVAMATTTVYAQTPPINAGDIAPVPERQGLLGTYFSFTGAAPPGSPPGSPALPNSTTATLLGEQLDPTINIDFVANKPALNGGSSDMFMVAWTGRLVIGTTEAYTFFVSSDDGERAWFIDTAKAAPDMDHWVQRGNTQDTSAAINLTPGMTDVRVEFEQGNGGANCNFSWQTATIAKAIVPAASLRPPPGPAAPTLAASSPIGPPPAQVTLTWNAVAGATGYVIGRNGTVLTVINSGATTTFVDNTVNFGTTYNYIIQSTSHATICIGPQSNTATVTPVLPAVMVLPNTGLQTNENGTSTTATITFNQALTLGQSVTFTFTSNRPAEGIVSSSGQGPAGSITFTINGPVAVNATVPLTITGVDDSIVDGPQAYLISCTTSGQFGAVTVPDLQCTNNDNDVPGITFSRTAGLLTSENGTSDSFIVQLNTQPTAQVTLSLASSNVLEGTVSPATLYFTTTAGQAYSTATGIGGWNVNHVVTVTGVDDTVLDFTVPYTIISAALVSTDPGYNNMTPPNVACSNLDNEVPPVLPAVWGNSSCGLMGAEFLLPVVVAVFLRRRRRNS